MSPHFVRAYEEIFEFMMSAPRPEQIITFHPSNGTEQRVRYLLHAKRAGALSPDEARELADFNRAEELLRMMTVRARQKLSHQ
jgi:hypothetical protein